MDSALINAMCAGSGVPAENPDEWGWHGVGMGLAWGWHGVGIGMGLSWGWHGVGMGLAWGWHGAAWGSHGVRMGFAWGSHGLYRLISLLAILDQSID
jgi:hypothetical protein